jgi:hypothetical protein
MVNRAKQRDWTVRINMAVALRQLFETPSPKRS